jgi:hypothetical protein
MVGLGVALLSPAVAQIMEAVHKKNLKKMQEQMKLALKSLEDDKSN